MKIVGIICEYNPFHLGHEKQIQAIRRQLGDSCGIVCLMSGNYVQRGAPAIFDKTLRAQAAVLCGADLVLELPIPYVLSSAEGFAAGGVKLLSGFCDGLSFGCESGDAQSLMATAEALLSPEFPEALHRELEKGLSFPAARQAALGERGALLRSPNDILAVEYCKAILAQGSAMEPLPIRREGNYHDLLPDPENPSATSLRGRIVEEGPWLEYVPEIVRDLFADASAHTLAAGERAILARLRTMTDGEFEALPFGSEGLWRKFMRACRSEATLEQILSATKSKRYTRSRLDRMAMCAFLGLRQEDLDTLPVYSRVLALNCVGQTILKQARKTGLFPNCGSKPEHPYLTVERRAEDLYGLFALDTPEAPGRTDCSRVFSSTSRISVKNCHIL